MRARAIVVRVGEVTVPPSGDLDPSTGERLTPGPRAVICLAAPMAAPIEDAFLHHLQLRRADGASVVHLVTPDYRLPGLQADDATFQMPPHGVAFDAAGFRAFVNRLNPLNIELLADPREESGLALGLSLANAGFDVELVTLSQQPGHLEAGVLAHQFFVSHPRLRISVLPPRRAGRVANEG